MRLISWNCCMAFRNKVKLVLDLKPDLVIIPECEHPGKLEQQNWPVKPTAALWVGTNMNKGLGVFSFGSYKIKMEKHNRDIQHVMPISVSSANFKLKLLAIWANHPTDKDGQYVEQVWKGIHHYNNLISRKCSIIMGDFNSNTIWDKKRRISNHSNVVNKLRLQGIESCYHLHHQQIQGQEKHSTLHLYRHLDKPYHIDYCFASNELIKQLKSVEIGNYETWIPFSDHLPLIVDFNDFHPAAASIKK